MRQTAVALRSAATAIGAAVNRVHLCGAVHAVGAGRLAGVPTVEFTLGCASWQRRLPEVTPAPAHPCPERGALDTQKDLYTVRCAGTEDFVLTLQGLLTDGTILEVTGRLATAAVADGAGEHTFTTVVLSQECLQKGLHSLHLAMCPAMDVRRARATYREAVYRTF